MGRRGKGLLEWSWGSEDSFGGCHPPCLYSMDKERDTVGRETGPCPSSKPGAKGPWFLSNSHLRLWQDMFQAWGFVFNQTTVRSTEKLTTTSALSFPLCVWWPTHVLYSLYCDRHLDCFSWPRLQTLALMRFRNQSKAKQTKRCHLDCPLDTRVDTETLWSLNSHSSPFSTSHPGCLALRSSCQPSEFLWAVKKDTALPPWDLPFAFPQTPMWGGRLQGIRCWHVLPVEQWRPGGNLSVHIRGTRSAFLSTRGLFHSLELSVVLPGNCLSWTSWDPDIFFPLVCIIDCPCPPMAEPGPQHLLTRQW